MSKPRNLNDLIRIEDAIRVLCQKTCTPGVACPDIYCKEMWEAFEDVERVDAVPVRRGKWIAVTEDGDVYKRICSCCGQEAFFQNDDPDELYDGGRYELSDFCPWCGARMGNSDG